MKILVTGAAGFIGSHTVEVLERQGHQVLAVDNFTTGKSENLLGFRGKIGLCDITDARILETCFSDFRPDTVLHLAAQSAISTAFSAPQQDLRVNGIGTLNVLKMANKYNVKWLVFSSTSAVYREGNSIFRTSEHSECSPNTPYGISKLAAEHYIRLFFPRHTILRYGNVYGPRQQPIGQNQVIARAFRHFIHGDEFKVNGDGKQKRDFVYVEDVAAANAQALVYEFSGTYNLSSGKSYSVNQVLSEMEEIYGVRGYKWEHTKEMDPRRNVRLDVSSIQNFFGWRADTSLADGLKHTAAWWKDRK